MQSKRVLISIPSKSHVEIALDELTGLEELGYICKPFAYTAKDGYNSVIKRLLVIYQNAYQLAKLAKSFNPDIIYFNSRLEKLAGIRDFLTICIVKALYRKKVLFVIKSHGSDLSVVQNNSSVFKNTILAFLKRNVSAWLFLSSEERSKLIELDFFDRQKMFVVKNIVRHFQFKRDENFRVGLGIPPNHKILLFTGRLIAEKGIIEVVEAFTIMNNKYPLTLIVVGDGEAVSRLKEIIAQNDLINHVILTGFIPEHAVIPYYANSDILVFPTYFPEGFPMALFNSIGAGLAVITTKIRAAKDYLKEPDNCLWVNPQDTKSVTQAIERLLASEALISRMREENKALSLMFSKEQIAIELSGIFEQLTRHK
ncbi:glycosyltransferase family 4 protein [Mucilaginibacter lutimaris]|uniref:Glycosyltransferase family 4 protein n=1 Tax=Mucilaginibacter lutimaris TaxID=931629 RepID=A0ABW2ZL07_9SPHI